MTTVIADRRGERCGVGGAGSSNEATIAVVGPMSMVAIIIATVIGVLVGGIILRLGLPRARRRARPWKWVVGILTIALSVMAWPPVIIYFGQQPDGSVALVALFLAMLTNGWGGKQLADADKTRRQQMVDDALDALMHTIFGR